MSILKINNVSYRYGNNAPWVLKDVNMEFEKGKIYGIVGPSGVGKTTLLSILSGLTRPVKGEVLFNEKSLNHIDSYFYRSNLVGVIFQGYNLLPQLNGVENVELSLDISEKDVADKKLVAIECLNRVGLTEEIIERPILKLSGGEQQRVAIARAISYQPELILADEPTGNLDQNTQDDVMRIFKDLAYKEGKCIIIVTHSPEVAEMVDELYRLT